MLSKRRGKSFVDHVERGHGPYRQEHENAEWSTQQNRISAARPECDRRRSPAGTTGVRAGAYDGGGLRSSPIGRRCRGVSDMTVRTTIQFGLAWVAPGAAVRPRSAGSPAGPAPTASRASMDAPRKALILMNQRLDLPRQEPAEQALDRPAARPGRCRLWKYHGQHVSQRCAREKHRGRVSAPPETGNRRVPSAGRQLADLVLDGVAIDRRGTHPRRRAIRRGGDAGAAVSQHDLAHGPQ